MSGTGRSGTGDGGSPYNSNGDARDFPGVPYSAEHFTPRDQCPSGDGKVYVFPYCRRINYNDFQIFRQCKRL